MSGQPHFEPRANRIVQIFCGGGVSHIDTFDYKPELANFHGKSLDRGENKGFFGQPGKIMKSPFEFQQYGESGAWVSSLFPHLAKRVDDIAFIKSMVAKSNNHTPATFHMNSGFTLNGFPCMGAWLSYGLGTVNENLPTFVVLPDPARAAGGRVYQLDRRLFARVIPRGSFSYAGWERTDRGFENANVHPQPQHTASLDYIARYEPGLR